MAEAKDVRATGYEREDGRKGYRLNYGGRFWNVHKEGNWWHKEESDLRAHTMKELKLLMIETVEAGLPDPKVEKDEIRVPATNITRFEDLAAAMEEGDVVQSVAAWDCIHPCALLILCQVEMGPEVLRTLDAFGYLTPDGVPDVEGALREYQLKYEQPMQIGGQQEAEPEEVVRMPVEF